jgi:hypothetical protein
MRRSVGVATLFSSITEALIHPYMIQADQLSLAAVFARCFENLSQHAPVELIISSRFVFSWPGVGALLRWTQTPT